MGIAARKSKSAATWTQAPNVYLKSSKYLGLKQPKQCFTPIRQVLLISKHCPNSAILLAFCEIMSKVHYLLALSELHLKSQAVRFPKVQRCCFKYLKTL